MGALSLGTLITAWLFNKFPAGGIDHTAVMASQLRAEREAKETQGMA